MSYYFWRKMALDNDTAAMLEFCHSMLFIREFCLFLFPHDAELLIIICGFYNNIVFFFHCVFLLLSCIILQNKHVRTYVKSSIHAYLYIKTVFKTKNSSIYIYTKIVKIYLFTQLVRMRSYKYLIGCCQE